MYFKCISFQYIYFFIWEVQKSRLFIYPLLPLSQHFFCVLGGVFDSMFTQTLTSSLKLPVCFKGVWLVFGKAKLCKRTTFQLQPKVFIFIPSFLFQCQYNTLHPLSPPPIISFRSNQPELITVERNIAPNSFGKFPFHCEDVQFIPLSLSLKFVLVVQFVLKCSITFMHQMLIILLIDSLGVIEVKLVLLMSLSAGTIKGVQGLH